MALIAEGAEYIGESGTSYVAVSPLGQANVWTAVDQSDKQRPHVVVLKAPDSRDPGRLSWPRFQHEMVMHELFKDCEYIRRQVDRIPPVKDSDSPPILVLEIFESTLWHARTKRPFTKAEVKSTARQILLGLKEVHDRGLVYADLKMQNVMVSGFHPTDSAADGSELRAKLGDLGIVMEPSTGTVQPVAYRAPEVYFKGQISQAADLWAFGLIYCHLLEARCRFQKTGLYDDLYTGTGSMPEREQAMRYALTNDHGLHDVDYYQDCALPYRDGDHEVGQQWDELSRRGLDEDDIDLLKWILTADPRQRPSARSILASRWFDDAAPSLPPSSLQPGSGDQTNGHASGPDRSSPPSDRRRGSTAGSGVRERRDANSIAPSTPASAAMPNASRPEGMLRGASQVTYTPAAEPTQAEVQEPLVKSAVTASAAAAVGRPEGGDVVGGNETGGGERRPDHLQHIGRMSSQGGTWLSYH